MKNLEFYNTFGSAIVLGVEPQLEFFKLEHDDFVTLEGFQEPPTFLGLRLGVEAGVTIVTVYCDAKIVVRRDGEMLAPMDPPP